MACRRTFPPFHTESLTCVDQFLIPVECVNYFLTNTTESTSEFTWDEVSWATGYNVYRATEADPLNFILTETNIPVSTLSIDCEWVIVTALRGDYESPMDTCTPIHFCVAAVVIDTTLLCVGFRFFEFGTSYSAIGALESDNDFGLPYPLPAMDPPTDPTRFLSATGGVPPYTWSIESGILPEGLSLNSSTGEITGIPMPLTPPQRVPNVANLNRAIGRIASVYPVVFKCEDSAANIAYSAQDVLVSWSVRVIGTGDFSTVDGVVVMHSGANAGGNVIGNLWWRPTGSPSTWFNVWNYDNLDFWTAISGAYLPTDSPRPIADLLGTYNLDNGIGGTGSITLS